MIKGCIFDLDNTLIDDLTSWKVALEKTCLYIAKNIDRNIKADEIFDMYEKKSNIFWNNYSEYLKRLKNRNERREFVWTRVFEDLNYPFNKEKITCVVEMFTTYRNESIIMMDEANTLLQKLKTGGKKIIICTDGEKDLQEFKLRKSGLIRYVSDCIAADEIGHRKPDREIFESCIRSSGFKVSELIYFGDDYCKDIIGARKAGIEAIQIGGHNGNSLREIVENYNRIF